MESNTDMSVGPGVMWKSMNKEEKDVYMDIACEVDAEHKRKYPNYAYYPKDACIQKALLVGGHK
jgi:hypothetical protein